MLQQPIDSPYSPASSPGRQIAGANSSGSGYNPPGFLAYNPAPMGGQPQAPGDSNQTGGSNPSQTHVAPQAPQQASKTPMAASSAPQTIPPPQGAPAIGTNGQSATATPAPSVDIQKYNGPMVNEQANPAQGAAQPATSGAAMPAASPAPQTTAANGQPASIANLGSTIDAQLQNPNPYNSANVQQIYGNLQQQMQTQLNQNLAATDANFASRGLYNSSPASDAQSWQRAQYQMGLSNLASNLTQMAGQGQLQGQSLANQAALGFTGQAQNADAQQMEAAIQAANIGLAGAPSYQTGTLGMSYLPTPDFGSVSPQAFQSLGALFANQPTNYSPYGYNPYSMNQQRYAPAGGQYAPAGGR